MKSLAKASRTAQMTNFIQREIDTYHFEWNSFALQAVSIRIWLVPGLLLSSFTAQIISCLRLTSSRTSSGLPKCKYGVIYSMLLSLLLLLNISNVEALLVSERRFQTTQFKQHKHERAHGTLASVTCCSYRLHSYLFPRPLIPPIFPIIRSRVSVLPAHVIRMNRSLLLQPHHFVRFKRIQPLATYLRPG